MNLKALNNLLPVTLLLLFFVSCKKEDLTTKNESSSNPNVAQRSASSEEFLSFSNFENFYETLEYVKALNATDLENWEVSNDFLSMRNVFDQIVLAESVISARLDTIPADSVSYYESLPTQHSPLCSTYNYMLVTKTEEGGSFFDANINDYNFSYLVNSHGIVKIGNKIYQFTSEYIKTIDDGDAQKIPNLLEATDSDPTNKITVTNINSDYVALHKVSSTATFVRSNIGDNGRNRVIVYQNWDQKATTQPNTKVSTYKARVRSLKRRLRGLWYDNDKRNLSLSGSVLGNQTYGKLANGSFVTVNWTFSVSNLTGGTAHTWDYFLPSMYGMNQTLRDLVTDGYHPEIFSSSIQGQAGNASATTTY